MSFSTVSIKLTQAEEECLKELKELVKGNKELARFSSHLDETFLLHFVRGKKCKAKKANACVIQYFNTRTDQYPEFFKTLSAPTCVDLLSRGPLNWLKHRDAEGGFIAIIEPEPWKPHEFSTDDLLRSAVLIMEELWQYEGFDNHGHVFVFDMIGFNLRHMKVVTPFFIKKIVSIFLNAYPIRVKGLHFVNVTYLSTLLFKIVASVLPPKIRKRFNLYTSANMHELHEHLSPEILPKTLGGKLSDDEAFMDLKEFTEKVIAHQDYYKKFAQLL